MKKYKIGIIGGTGGMGKCFKIFFEDQGHEVLISGRKTPLSHEECTKISDIVIFTIPIRKTAESIRKLIPYTNKDQLLTDFTSLKISPVNEMMKSEASVIGMHPMFGPTTTIKNQNVILTPERPGKWLEFLKNLLQKSGANVHIMTAEEHDEFMSIIQGISHFSDVVLADTIARSGKGFEKIKKLFTPPFLIKSLILGRLFSQDPNLYGDIQMMNPKLGKILEQFLRSAEKYKKIIQNKDTEEFNNEFRKTSKYFGKFLEEAAEKSEEIISFASRENKVLEDEKVEKSPKSILVFGSKGSYTDEAARDFLKEGEMKLDVVNLRSIKSIFKYLKDGSAKFAFIPIENSINGSVGEVLDEFFDSEIKINAIKKIKINHVIAKKKDTKNIEKILSHPQSFGQCSEYLSKNFPNARRVSFYDNSTALREVAQSRESLAGIGPKNLAIKLNLEVISDNITDNKENITSFVFVGKELLNNSKNNRISLCFTTKNRPGALFKILKVFSEGEINLTKIESRPMKKIQGEYIFFVNIEGNLEDEKIKKVFKKVKMNTSLFKILGVFSE